MTDRTYLEDKLTRILSRRDQLNDHQLRLLITGIEISLLGAEGEQVALGLLDSYRGTLSGWIDIKKRDGTIVTLDGTEYTMHRDPQETDKEYQERKNLFVDLEKGGGRMVIAVEDLSEYEIKMIEKAADEYPEDSVELEAFRSGDLATDLGLPQYMRTQWALVRAIVFALEAANIEQGDFAREMGLPGDVLIEALGKGGGQIEFTRLVEMYDAAAARAGWGLLKDLLNGEVDWRNG